MQLRRTVYTTTAIFAAASLAALGAWWAALAVESRSAAAVKSQLLISGVGWASVSADGLQIHLSGTAPNEAARFRTVNLVGTVVQAARIRDRLEVAAFQAIEAPRFSVEILRNDDGISLIGLVPGKAREDQLVASVAKLARGTQVADMLETADFPAPANWDKALDFGLFALERLPRSKISVSADLVAVTAISGSTSEKRRLESDLARALPAGIKADIDISAPRPVLTPFTLRFVKDEGGARFDACSADTIKARDRILSAGSKAGNSAKTACTVGLGVPTPRWTEAAELAIGAVSALGNANVTFSDADVSLVAAETTPQALFDRVVGDLQTQLPPVFSLKAVLTPKPSVSPQGPAEFTAVLDKDGQAQLRGRLTDDIMREAVDSFAKAQFGADRVYTATRPDANLPDGWPVRVLAGLEALAQLHHGELTVQPDLVKISGVTGNPDGKARISQILSGKLGQGQTFGIDVAYDEKFDPSAALPTPGECAARLNSAMSLNKINFAPGSAEIDVAAEATIDTLAEILAECPPLEMEIGGYTDAQGSEGGNRALSQARAEAVLIALQGRRLKMAGFVATGYGEDNPVADNDSEAGREANRRIEFKLLSEPEETPRMSAIDLVRAAQDAQDAAGNGAQQDAAPQVDPEAAGGSPADIGADANGGSGGDVSGGDVSGGDAGPDTAAPLVETPLTAAGDPLRDLPDPGAVRGASLLQAPESLFTPTDNQWPRPRRRP
tara:strand:+ start:1507 stop:3690 length:2184 start_codon:yes stop_codon:yes gene_type:complete